MGAVDGSEVFDKLCSDISSKVVYDYPVHTIYKGPLLFGCKDSEFAGCGGSRISETKMVDSHLPTTHQIDVANKQEISGIATSKD